MTQKADYAVVIGRFQPFHNGHLELIRAAHDAAHNVIVLVGSANIARSTRNPFTFDERVRMILLATTDGENISRITVAPLNDHVYDEKGWIEEVQHRVASITATDVSPSIVLVGHERDHSSYYLRLFPQWSYIGFPSQGDIEATNVRRRLFAPNWHPDPEVPSTTNDFLGRWRETRDYTRLLAEAAYFMTYEDQWGKGPWFTVDAVVVQSGHVLLVERGDHPGKGMLALPGGFLEPHERLLDGALRELEEETAIGFLSSHGGTPTLDAPLLKSYLKGQHVFDDPHRSQRGRVITHAFLFDLPPGPLPAVRGMDDAKEAKWVPLSDLRVDQLFEDHAFVIRRMLKFI